jgi:3',5'-cyclic AMP phosphodiesterase CpdA
VPPADLQGSAERNLERIHAELAQGEGPLTIAFTSDPHHHYGDLKDLVTHMRADASIGFVVVPGDLADQGLLGEFVAFARIMNELPMPWLATIGNHDHLGNGRIIYESLFGPRNFTLDLRGYRFIFFDDTVWESDAPPDMVWLQAALDGRGARTPIVIAHIPPFTDQLQGAMGAELHAMVLAAGVPLFVHGHQHVFRDADHYGDGVRYLGIPWPQRGSYVKLRLEGETFHIEQVSP